MPTGPAVPILPMVLVVRGKENDANEYAELAPFLDLLSGTAPSQLMKRLENMVLDAPTTFGPIVNKEVDFYALLAGQDGTQAYFNHWCV